MSAVLFGPKKVAEIITCWCEWGKKSVDHIVTNETKQNYPSSLNRSYWPDSDYLYYSIEYE